MAEITTKRKLFLHELGDILFVERKLADGTWQVLGQTNQFDIQGRLAVNDGVDVQQATYSTDPGATRSSRCSPPRRPAKRSGRLAIMPATCSFWSRESRAPSSGSAQ